MEKRYENEKNTDWNAGSSYFSCSVNLLSVQAAENAGVMEYIAATEYIGETEAAEPEMQKNRCLKLKKIQKQQIWVNLRSTTVC